MGTARNSSVDTVLEQLVSSSNFNPDFKLSTAQDSRFTKCSGRQTDNEGSDMLAKCIRESARIRKSTMHKDKSRRRLSQSLASPRTPRDGDKSVSNKSLSGSPSQSSFPILRWFADSSGASTSKTPASEIQDALWSDIRSSTTIQRPVPALLSPAIAAGRNSTFRRAPPLLESLTRSTLPTASLSLHPVDDTYDRNEELVEPLAQSPPSRTSLESLRSIYEQRTDLNSNNANLQTGTFSNAFSKWWFKREDLLEEDDRADANETEEERIRRRCNWF